MASNHTTSGATEAVIEDIPVAVTEEINSQRGTSEAPALGQSGSDAGVMTTGAGEETETVTVHPLTTGHPEFTEHGTPFNTTFVSSIATLSVCLLQGRVILPLLHR